MPCKLDQHRGDVPAEVLMADLDPQEGSQAAGPDGLQEEPAKHPPAATAAWRRCRLAIVHLGIHAALLTGIPAHYV
jgi:hypothetical protein